MLTVLCSMFELRQRLSSQNNTLLPSLGLFLWKIVGKKNVHWSCEILQNLNSCHAKNIHLRLHSGGMVESHCGLAAKWLPIVKWISYSKRHVPWDLDTRISVVYWLRFALTFQLSIKNNIITELGGCTQSVTTHLIFCFLQL